MKTRYKIGLWAAVAVAGSTILGGLWVWLIGIIVVKLAFRLLCFSGYPF